MKLVGQIAVLAACAALSACTIGVDGKADVNQPTVETVPANPPTVTLTATTSEVIAGDDVTLTWNSTNGSRCVATGSWKGDLATSGTFALPVNDAGTKVFVLNCSGSGGSQAAVAEVQVIPVSSGGGTGSGTGSGSGSGVISVTLSADPTSVAVGDSTTITWFAQDAASCTASGAWSGTKAPTGSESVVVGAAGYNSFSLNCSGPDGSGVQQIHVQGLQATLTIRRERDHHRHRSVHDADLGD